MFFIKMEVIIPKIIAQITSGTVTSIFIIKFKNYRTRDQIKTPIPA